MTFKDLVTELMGAANTIVIPVLFAIAFVSILWGLTNYFFFKAGSDEGRATGRAFAIWGILGLVLLVSLWGVVHILLDTFGLTPS